MQRIELGSPDVEGPSKPRAPGAEAKVEDGVEPAAAVGRVAERENSEFALAEWSIVKRWLLDDILFIAMLLLAFVGVTFRLPVSYWFILTPVFGIISIAEGWSHFHSQGARVGLALRVGSIWGALLLAIFLLFNSGVAGVMNANATSLAMMTLLALGTFVAGVQARVWQICAVGGILFLAVPGVGWLDQSPLLLAVATAAIIGLAGVVWWVVQRRRRVDVALTPETRTH